MPPNKCENCEILKIELSSSNSKCEGYKKLFEENKKKQNSENTNSGNNICCMRVKEENDVLINSIKALRLVDGKMAQEYEEKEVIYKKERDEAVKKRDEANAKILKLETENETLKNRNKISASSTARQLQEITNLEEKIADLRSDKNSLNSINQELNEEIKTLKAEITTANFAAHRSDTELDKLKGSLQSIMKECEMEYNSKIEKLNQNIFNCNDEIQRLNKSLGKNLEEKRLNEENYNQEYGRLNQELYKANYEREQLRRGNNELTAAVNPLKERVTLLETQIRLQMEQRKHEADNLNLSLNQSIEKIKTLELRLATEDNSPEFTFIYLDQVFEDFKQGGNLQIGNSLREMLLNCYPELFPNPDLPQNSKNGCKLNDSRLSSQQNIVLVVAKLGYASENNWRIYSTTEKGENPITDNIVETMKRYRFQIQINGELKCRSQELEQIVHFIYKCNVTKLDLSGQFNSKNDNYKIVFSPTLKHAYFNSFSILDENKKKIEISKFFKEIPNLETVEWVSPIYKNDENFADLPFLPKLREFELKVYSSNYNISAFGEFVKKHGNQTIHCIIQLLNLRDDLKNKIEKELANITADLSPTCRVSPEFC